MLVTLGIVDGIANRGRIGLDRKHLRRRCEVRPEPLQAVVSSKQGAEHRGIGEKNLPALLVRRRHPDERIELRSPASVNGCGFEMSIGCVPGTLSKADRARTRRAPWSSSPNGSTNYGPNRRAAIPRELPPFDPIAPSAATFLRA